MSVVLRVALREARIVLTIDGRIQPRGTNITSP